jgi:hypothetical protein
MALDSVISVPALNSHQLPSQDYTRAETEPLAGLNGTSAPSAAKSLFDALFSSNVVAKIWGVAAPALFKVRQD